MKSFQLEGTNYLLSMGSAGHLIQRSCYPGSGSTAVAVVSVAVYSVRLFIPPPPHGDITGGVILSQFDRSQPGKIPKYKGGK